MKFLFFVSLLTISSASTSLLAATEDLKFIVPTSIKSVEGLPPTINATFEFDCNYTFEKLIRTEDLNAETGKVTIFLGGLIKQDPSKNCKGATISEVVPAGNLFSGREYEVRLISK